MKTTLFTKLHFCLQLACRPPTTSTFLSVMPPPGSPQPRLVPSAAEGHAPSAAEGHAPSSPASSATKSTEPLPSSSGVSPPTISNQDRYNFYHPISSSVSSESEYEFGISLATVVVPDVRRHAGIDPFVPAPGMNPLFPVVDPGHEWVGLTWGSPTSRVTNTCTIDPFLSHVLYLNRQYPGYLRRHLNQPDSDVEGTISTIATHYFSSKYTKTIF